MSLTPGPEPNPPSDATVQYVPPSFEPPYRVLLLAAAGHGWYQASGQDERARILASLRRYFEEWETRGARLLASFDDDYFLVGQPAALDYSIYVMYEVDSLELVAAMIQRVRDEIDDVRLDTCFRMEARIGRPLFLVSA
jgi:hypothetical protein